MKKNKILLLLIIIVFIIIGCSSGLKIIQVGIEPPKPWSKPYVSGMKGVENLVFDSKGSLFVTDLDGYIYRIEPTDDPFKGRIIAKKKLCTKCIGVEIGQDDMVYVAVNHSFRNGRIARLSKDFSKIEFITDTMQGLNGFEMDREGFLYFAASNLNPFFPKGKIYRIKTGDKRSFNAPEIVVDNAGIVNGLAFSPDETKLYYTEHFNGLWVFELQKKIKTKIYTARGHIHIYDDICTSDDGTVWLTFNSEKTLIPIRDGYPKAGYRVGELGAPSSCKFGKGEGFNSRYLYITEIGTTGRGIHNNGRGIWIFPVDEAVQ